MASYHISTMEQFNFSKPEEWPQWVKRFERFRQASGLASKSEVSQVNMLIYSMGQKADDILQSFRLTSEQEKKFDTVKEKFDGYFVQRRNPIFERAKFNMRKQGETEPVDSFITDLYTLAKYCEYDALHDEMIRDRIVVGIRDSRLSERMQMDTDLTLEKAVSLARQSESVKIQQPTVRGEVQQETAIEAVKGANKSFQRNKYGMPQTKTKTSSRPQGAKMCERCGRPGPHSRALCPAKDAECHKCGKLGHYKSVCKTKQTQPRVRAVEEEANDTFLGPIYASNVSVVQSSGTKWTRPVELNQREVSFKIDTGADVTVIPESYYRETQDGPLQMTQRKLTGAGQQPLSVQGYFQGHLRHNNTETEQEIFVVRGLSKPLLGRPAIEALAIVLLVEPVTQQSNSIIPKFPKVFQGLGRLKDSYKIKLQGNCQPYALTTPRRVAIPLLPKVEAELNRMQALGVIEKVEQPTSWCSGMVVVPKANGKVRICVDLTRLNKSVERERHILPSVEHTIAQIGGAKIFTKLDANSGFWQVELSQESSLLTTFITPFGRFCFRRLPFGITSAPEYFQKKMCNILSGLKGVVCLIDDVLVCGKTQQEHDQNLTAALQRIQDAGLTLNREKCEFNKTTVKFLGQVVDSNGISPDPEKISAITKMPEPTNITELRRFLGMVNQLNKFTPHLADQTRPLRQLLSNRNHWTWGDSQDIAFRELKALLTSSETLCPYNPLLPTVVSADASSFGLGAVLRQRHDDILQPVAYISRALTDTEVNYAQIEKEALAVTWACERFQDYLIGLHFTVETDHKPLVPLLSTKTLDQLPVRVQRFRLRMMRFSYSIIHVPGAELHTADALSRSPVSMPSDNDKDFQSEVSAYVDILVQQLPASDKKLQEIQVAQENDSICCQLKSYCQSGWPHLSDIAGPLKPFVSVKDELSVSKGLLLRGSRLVIPQSMRSEILTKIHSGHQGITKCRQRAMQSVWWPAISKDIGEMISKCVVCCKVRYQHAEPLLPSAFPDYPWQRVASDIFEWHKHKYLLVIDYYSRFIEIAKLSTATSTDIINRLKSIFARHGIPESFTSDNGPQYSAKVFNEFAREYGFTHSTSSPCYPQGNGAAERGVRTIKTLLGKSDDPYSALLAYRTTPLENGYSPAELLMSRKLRTTIPMIQKKFSPCLPKKSVVKEKEEKIRERQQKNFNDHHQARQLRPLQTGERVFIPDNSSEGTVLEEQSPRSYTVQTPQGTYRRNRRHLLPLPPDNVSQSSNSNDTTVSNDVSESLPSNSCRTRSGRISRPPERLNL